MMVVEYESRKPVDPFGKPFPTKLVLGIILVLIIAFFVARWIREPTMPPVPGDNIPTANETAAIELPLENITMAVPEPAYTIQDLEVPEFPVLDRELAGVV